MLASAAAAADLTFETPAPAPAPVLSPYDWSGFYIGLHVGGMYSEFDNNVPANPGPVGDAGGPIGGAQLGYNWQSGAWVFGIEGDVSGIDIEASSANGRYEEDVMGTLRLRVGHAWKSILAYATAGAAFTHVEARLTGAGADDDVAIGAAAGAGIEALIRQNWSVRAEYLFAHVPEESLNSGGVTIIGGSDNHIGRVGVNFHF